MKILLLTNIPSPYMIDFLNEFGKLCDLTVIFEKSASDERDASWNNFSFKNFKGIILSGINTSVDSAFCPQIILHIKANIYDDIIVTNPTTPTGICAIFYMKMLKIQYVIESEGGFPKNGNGIKEKFKKAIMKNAKFYFTTTGKDDAYFLKYGAIESKLVTYPFTSIFKHEIIENPLSINQKIMLRKTKGINTSKMVLAVGRFIPLKRFDMLIKAWASMDSNYILVIIGGGEELNNYKALCNSLGLQNVIFIDFISKKELFEYYRMADLFVHPTSSDVWGLVINEAMANALPVITTNMCIAGRVLVSDYENGFVIDNCDENKLAEKIHYVLSDETVLARMSLLSLKKINPYSYENMAHSHMLSLNEWRSK